MRLFILIFTTIFFFHSEMALSGPDTVADTLELRELIASENPEDINKFFALIEGIYEGVSKGESVDPEVRQLLLEHCDDTRRDIMISSDEVIVDVGLSCVIALAKVSAYDAYLVAQQGGQETVDPFAPVPLHKLYYSNEARDEFFRWYNKKYSINLPAPEISNIEPGEQGSSSQFTGTKNGAHDSPYLDDAHRIRLPDSRFVLRWTYTIIAVATLIILILIVRSRISRNS